MTTGSDHVIFFIDKSTSFVKKFLQLKCSHVLVVVEDLCVSVGVGLESVLVNDPFVEDESVAFGVRCYFELFGGWVSVEEVGVDDRDVPSFVERIKNFVVEVLTHDVIVKLSGSSHIERETSDFAADFALLGFVTVILGSSGSEFGDGIAVIEFVSHFS